MRTSGILEARAARTDTAIHRVSRNSFGGQSDWRSLTLVEIGLLHYHHNGSREIEVRNCILFQSGFAWTIGVSLPFQFSDPYIQRSTSEFATLFIIYLLYFRRDELIFCVREVVEIQLDSLTSVSIERKLLFCWENWRKELKMFKVASNWEEIQTIRLERKEEWNFKEITWDFIVFTSKLMVKVLFLPSYSRYRRWMTI